jgi:hypothetical protein
MVRCPNDGHLLLLVIRGEEGERRWARSYRCLCGYRQVSLVLTELRKGVEPLEITAPDPA